MSQKDKTRLIWTEKTIFFEIFEDENNSVKILPHIGNRETDRQFCRSFLSPFLWIGTRLDFFQLLGKDPLSKQFFKIIVRGLTIEDSHIFSGLIDISSYRCALLIFKEWLILRIPWSFNEIDDKLALVTGVVTRVKVPLFETGVHWDTNKALKWFAFSLKFDIDLLLIKMGGINGIFFPL